MADNELNCHNVQTNPRGFCSRRSAKTSKITLTHPFPVRLSTPSPSGNGGFEPDTTEIMLGECLKRGFRASNAQEPREIGASSLRSHSAIGYLFEYTHTHTNIPFDRSRCVGHWRAAQLIHLHI